MALDTLHSWAAKLCGVVDADSGNHVKRIRLISAEGSTWETWEAPLPSPEDFVQQVNTLLNALTDEFPVKRVQLLLVAEDTAGAVQSQRTLSIMGKNKQASSSLLSNDARALSDSMDAIARTVERVLATANTQLRVMAETNEKLAEHNNSLHDLVREMNAAKLLQEQQEHDTTREIQTEVVKALPMFIELLGSKLSGPTKGVLNGAAAAVKVVAAATSGAPPVTD